ncbi:unnamed protein product [Moneuplotes crassus]|uniref:Uncharacterized protein n=1 Tax=Euplotes crassus TaxID=5936 RepID=A0AAD2D8K9_EUPCR|nr:unnamed protein product [Moneuplotes crassus]
METSIATSVHLITQGFFHHEEKIKQLFRGYSFLNTPVVGVNDIGNCFDGLEEILSIRLVPISFARGETESDKVLPFQKQHFYQTLEHLASKYRGQRSLDTNAFRDILVDYLTIEGNEEVNKKLGYNLRVDYLFVSTMKKTAAFDPKITDLEPTHPEDAMSFIEEEDLQMMMRQAEMEGNQEKLLLLRDLYTLNTEFGISENNDERSKIRRKIELLKKRIDASQERTPSKKTLRKKLRETPLNTQKQRIKDLKEIFKFYSRQHLMIGKLSTFDNIQKQTSILNMGDFVLFCKDFKVPLDKRRCATVYKLNSLESSNQMTFDQFVHALPKLFREKYKDEIDKLNGRIGEIKKIYKQKKRKFVDALKQDEAGLLKIYEELKKEEVAKEKKKGEMEMEKQRDEVKEEKEEKEEKEGKEEEEERKQDEKKELVQERKEQVEEKEGQIEIKNNTLKPDPSKDGKLRIIDLDLNIRESDDENLKSVGGNPVNPKLQKSKPTKKNKPPPYNPHSSLAQKSKLDSTPRKDTKQDSNRNAKTSKDEPQEGPEIIEEPSPETIIMNKHRDKIRYIISAKFDRNKDNPELNILRAEKERIQLKIEEIKKKMSNTESIEKEANELLDQHVEKWKSLTPQKKGVALPFNTNVRDTEEGAKPSKKYKFKSNVHLDEIKEQVAQIKRRRERQKLKQIFEARLRYEKSRKYIQREHERLLQKKNDREFSYHNEVSPYENDALDSARDHLYLIIPKNPKRVNKNQSVQEYSRERTPFRRNSGISIGNSSEGSMKHHIYHQNQRESENPIKIRDLSHGISKPRERSRRLYHRKDEIYLPEISKHAPPNRGRSLLQMHDVSAPNLRNIQRMRNNNSLENHHKASSKLSKAKISRKLRNPLRAHRNNEIDLSIH